MVRQFFSSVYVQRLGGLAALLGVCVALPAQAQILTELGFQAPPVGSPGNREAGSGRSDTCASLSEHAGLTAIVPETNVGLTTQATPQLFAYIPSNNAAFAELRLLKDATGEDVFVSQVSMPPAPSPGFIHGSSTLSLSLPETVTLEPGENYLWALMLVCNATNRAEDIAVMAVVQRADSAYLSGLPDEVIQQLRTLDQASDAERLLAYSSAGLWQDLLTELSVLVEADPDTYSPLWTSLLTDQGLGGIADAPFYPSQFTGLTSSVQRPQ